VIQTPRSLTTPDHRPESSVLAPERRPTSRAQLAWLLSIMAVGCAVRVLMLTHALRSPGYVWEDPDGYMARALRLVGRDGWAWTFDAATHTINGQRHALPPMYSIFLSLFALWPHFPLTAQIGQLVLAVLTIPLMFALGRRLHSSHAGLVAAGMIALWVPNIFGVWSTSQETLYVPLILIAFLLLARALDSDHTRDFAAAGLVFGAAALTRSMPLFFVGPAAVTHVALVRDRRRASVQALAFLSGFLLLTAPYSVALSRHFGQVTVIDTHGSIHLESASGTRAPSLIETATGFWRAVSAQPLAYFQECVERARSLLHVNGGRILQIYVVANSKATAALWKTIVHLGSDGLLVVESILAALGAALCRRPRLASFFLLWTVLNIGIASVGGFGGARLRAPFEPFMMLLAAVVLSGGWRRPSVVAVGTGGAIGILAAVAVLPQLPRSLKSWPDYGVAWPSIFSRPGGLFTGAAGINVPAFDGVAVLTATPAASVTLRIRIGGVHVRTMEIRAREEGLIRIPWPERGLAFVELDQIGPPENRPTIDVHVPTR
jgi:dolichyl-phosphate-mannose-protein mannosyltransferase